MDETVNAARMALAGQRNEDSVNLTRGRVADRDHTKRKTTGAATIRKHMEQIATAALVGVCCGRRSRMACGCTTMCWR
ncbi:hypothetical protein [Kitasatospora sp. NPDC047058]|uniref:hypothetical protein n=1 Tax=Kitasatospora sp. NPDC047058 TaxID=3155620 RepID=UPI0033E6C9FB